MTHPRMAPIKIIVLLSVMLNSPLSETINYIKNITGVRNWVILIFCRREPLVRYWVILIIYICR
jgi:hypothetical protein